MPKKQLFTDAHPKRQMTWEEATVGFIGPASPQLVFLYVFIFVFVFVYSCICLFLYLFILVFVPMEAMSIARARRQGQFNEAPVVTPQGRAVVKTERLGSPSPPPHPAAPVFASEPLKRIRIEAASEPSESPRQAITPDPVDRLRDELTSDEALTHDDALTPGDVLTPGETSTPGDAPTQATTPAELPPKKSALAEALAMAEPPKKKARASIGKPATATASTATPDAAAVKAKVKAELDIAYVRPKAELVPVGGDPDGPVDKQLHGKMMFQLKKNPKLKGEYAMLDSSAGKKAFMKAWNDSGCKFNQGFETLRKTYSCKKKDNVDVEKVTYDRLEVLLGVGGACVCFLYFFCLCLCFVFVFVSEPHLV